LALTAGLRSPRKLAGILGMSAWLPLGKSYPGKLGQKAKEIPTLMCSGDADNVVNPLFSSHSAKTMSDLGIQVEFKSYAGLAHSANPEELHDVRDFLKSALPLPR
jgi:lysophospholipase I